MFCDLAGSTGISTRIDPEDLALVRSIQEHFDEGFDTHDLRQAAAFKAGDYELAASQGRA